MTQNLIVFTGTPTRPSHDHPRPERLASRANPLRTTWSHFAPAGVSAGQFLFKLLIRGAIGGGSLSVLSPHRHGT